MRRRPRSVHPVRLSPGLGLRALGVICILALPGAAFAQANGAAPGTVQSTRAGVYSPDQATQGKDLYALNCQACHGAGSHTAPGFTTKWQGRPLYELYDYVRSSMPKSDPGSLSRREYVLVLAYLLKLNGMPAGSAELPADSLALRRIRIDWTTTADSTPNW